MERKPASMERFVFRANLQKQGSYCNKIISEIKKKLKKIVWIITTPGERQACVLWGIWLNSFPYIR